MLQKTSGEQGIFFLCDAIAIDDTWALTGMFYIDWSRNNNSKNKKKKKYCYCKLNAAIRVVVVVPDLIGTPPLPRVVGHNQVLCV